MVGTQLGADLEKHVVRHAEFTYNGLRLYLGLGVLAAKRLVYVFRLARTGAEHDRGVAIVGLARALLLALLHHRDFALLLGAHADDLAAFERQDSDRHMGAVGAEHAR